MKAIKNIAIAILAVIGIFCLFCEPEDNSSVWFTALLVTKATAAICLYGAYRIDRHVRV